MSHCFFHLLSKAVASSTDLLARQSGSKNISCSERQVLAALRLAVTAALIV